MRIHFISIGGAVMHNLALELKANGHDVTGSDDEIYDPSRSRLKAAGLLPHKMGWDADRIDPEIDLVLLGMHARANNEELLRAQELGLRIQSFPEFIGNHSQGKTQIVVAGSHGKTTTTSMIMHVLRDQNIDFDYLVGAQLEGFDRMVRLSDAPIIVIEGDEYLSSPIDRTPKFMHYDPEILILTGVQWDHMNVFPRFEDYISAFKDLLNVLPPKAKVFYDIEDVQLVKLIGSKKWSFDTTGYSALNYDVRNGQFFIEEELVPVNVVGRHNMKNLSAATSVLEQLNINKNVIHHSFGTFKGASKRQDVLKDTTRLVIFRDFAHAPSKVRATLHGIRELYPERHLIAVCELHTYSSLNKAFLPEYTGALDSADAAAVFYSPQTLKIKKMQALAPEDIRHSFANEKLHVMTDSENLLRFLKQETKEFPAVVLLMSSGTFGGLTNEVLASL